MSDGRDKHILACNRCRIDSTVMQSAYLQYKAQLCLQHSQLLADGCLLLADSIQCSTQL